MYGSGEAVGRSNVSDEVCVHCGSWTSVTAQNAGVSPQCTLRPGHLHAITRRTLRRALFGVGIPLSLLLASSPSRAQEPLDSDAAQDQGALRVFFDCSGRDCNSSYYRTEIDWVNWVRDRTLAQVHLIMTSQTNASGGRE